MHRSPPHAFLIPLVFFGSLTAGCKRQTGSDLQTEVARLSAEVETVQKKLSGAEKEITARQDAWVLANTEAEAMRKLVVEKEREMAGKEVQIQALGKEVAALKKSDGIIFAEIRAVQHQGLTSLALGRLQKFVNDYPDSPLIADASRAITELSGTAEREKKVRVMAANATQPEREILKRFADGFATAEEMAPVLRRKTMAEVIKMLGTPNRTYRGGTEIGYVDKVLESSGSGREALVISFEGNRVRSVRAGYQGREIRP